VLRTLGRTSGGISLGFTYGFDSGQMMDYVYENRARGRLLIGRLVDRVYLDAVGWRAIRARKEALKTLLSELLLERAQQGLSTTVLDIASGPGRYLQEACLNQGGLEGVAVICRDLDPVGLEQGRRRAAELGLTSFRYEDGDACDPASLLTVTPQPDIAIASGLYELLGPPLIQRSMEGVHQLLAPEGRFIFTTQVKHPQLELIANTLTNRHGQPWVMVCRPLSETEEWARQAGFAVVSSRMEEVGLFGISLCRKARA
jgi:SAM-dependent methyltransferase